MAREILKPIAPDQKAPRSFKTVSSKMRAELNQLIQNLQNTVNEKKKLFRFFLL